MMMLTEIKRLEGRKSLYRCQCGVEKVLSRSAVSEKKTRSCGCLRRALTSARAKTHGHKSDGLRSKAYVTWVNMKSRCDNASRPDFASYGGRGIRYAPQWLSFAGFYADMGDPPDGMTLDRIDVNGPYCKDNCRWADRKTQMNNKRSNHVIEHDGRSQNLGQWAEEFGLGYVTLLKRLQRGVPFAAALSNRLYMRWPAN